MTTTSFDLLSTSAYGGCSAKLSPTALSELLSGIPLIKDARIMVDIETHDDAGVYKLNVDTALIVTTDFFPPVCSDAYTFGQIAAANALSDVYAMGGTPLLALNITLFPSKDIPLGVLGRILEGGQDKINESGAFTMGGHTIDDTPPKYGLAVVGTVHPDKLITNAGLTPGQLLILTKPLGVGVLMAAQRMGMADEEAYNEAIRQMKLLNKAGASCMQLAGVKGATDVTGFGLLGHALKMAEASHVTLQLSLASLPAIPQALSLLQSGCIPGAAFRNADFVKEHVFYAPSCTVEQKMLACDAQTSGGLLIGVDAHKADWLLQELQATSLHPQAAIIGEVLPRRNKAIYCQ